LLDIYDKLSELTGWGPDQIEKALRELISDETYELDYLSEREVRKVAREEAKEVVNDHEAWEQEMSLERDNF